MLPEAPLLVVSNLGLSPRPQIPTLYSSVTASKVFASGANSTSRSMISIHGDTFVVRRAFILGQSVIVSPLANPRYRQRRDQLTAEAFGFEIQCQLVRNIPRKIIAQSGLSDSFDHSNNITHPEIVNRIAMRPQGPNFSSTWIKRRGQT